jgi:hypothetical protein
VTDAQEPLLDQAAHERAYAAFVAAVEAGELDEDASRRAQSAGDAEGDGSPA